MNKFEMVKTYFRNCSYRKDITRKEYIAFMSSTYGLGAVTCDNCRCILMTAGYLGRPGRGIYRKIRYIPYCLTYMQARNEAYPKIKESDMGDY